MSYEDSRASAHTLGGVIGGTLWSIAPRLHISLPPPPPPDGMLIAPPPPDCMLIAPPIGMQVRQAHSDLVEARRAERGANQQRVQRSEVERRMKLAIEEAEQAKVELERVREEAKGAASRQQVWWKRRPNFYRTRPNSYTPDG